MSLSDEEKFRFDLQGFVILRGVLDRSSCDALSEIADAAWPAQPHDGAYRRAEYVSRWHQAMLDLSDHPRVLPALVELIGPRLRLDHDYSIFMRRGPERFTLHGGPFLFETDHWYRYHDGVMRNGLTVANWNLTDAPASAGGFFYEQELGNGK